MPSPIDVAELFASQTRAYLERIKLADALERFGPQPSAALLLALHQAHLLAVPFENLSIHYGQPIILDDEALFEKIVRRRRGGFCYELNGLFAWLLRRLGFTVEMLSAGVAEGEGDFSPEFDHMTLLVRQVEGKDWLADVGFGDSFRQPLRLVADVAQDGADGHTYRLARDTSDYSVAAWLMQQRDATGGWDSQYRFTLQPRLLGEFVPRCAFQQTSPDSHFTQRRICTLALLDGRLTLSDLRLISTLHGAREERELASENEYRRVLAERFGVTL